jgi:hypothetical protein
VVRIGEPQVADKVGGGTMLGEGRRRIACSGAALGVILLVGGGTMASVAGSAAAPPTAPAGLDHFKCYTTTKPAFKPRTVTVKDQFVSGKTAVLSVQTLCNPVSKRYPVSAKPSRVLHRQAHLTCYQTRDSGIDVKARKVSVTNQFGRRELTVLRPVSLCVPSLKSKAPAPPRGPNPEQFVDHFRCYAVKEQQVGKQLILADQFGRAFGRTLNVERLCNPVSKNGGPIRRRTAHLVCYSWLDGNSFKVVSVRVRNQFGLVDLRAVKAETLCLPSLKRTAG